MHVFVVTASWISEHTLMTETVGVYAHMHQTITPARLLKAEGKGVLVTKHEVIEPAPTITLRVGKSVPAFEAPGPGGTPGVRPVGEGVQTDPFQIGGRA